MIALIARLLPLLKQLAPLVRAAWPILVAIAGALTDYYAQTGGKATAGAVGLLAGTYARRNRDELGLVAASVGFVDLPQSQPAAPVLEFRETGDHGFPFKVSAVHLRGERFSLENVHLAASVLDQPADHPFEDPAAHPTGEYPAVPLA